MTTQLFRQTTIAVIWDFDKTLIPGYMQDPLFARFSVDGGAFWREVNGLPQFQMDRGLELVSPDTLYLNHILTYVRAGRFAGLNNALLRQLGQEIVFYEGLPGFFPTLKGLVAQNPLFGKHEIALEHYIVSTGLRQMILGSAIAEHVDAVWGCEFVEEIAPPGYLDEAVQQEVEEGPELADIAYVIDNTTKTRAVFEINKGTNKWPEISVNHKVAREDRRIPFENMIYVADGPSDIPVFSILDQYGGKTFAVYQPENPAEFAQCKALLDQDRIQGFGPADYRPGTQTYMWLTATIDQIASRIVTERENVMGGAVGAPPRHLVDQLPAPASRATTADLPDREAPETNPQDDVPDREARA